MSGAVFAGIADFYDLVYAGKDTAGEARYVDALLRQHGVPASARLLEWGSGTGRHAAALASLGHRVTGVERSATMFSRSELLATGNPQLKFVCGDLLTADAGQSFDALIACFHVVSYLTGDLDIAQAFGKAYRALRPGGIFLFDVWHGPAVQQQLPETRCARFEDPRRELIRVAEPRHDPDAHRVDVHYRYFHRRRGEGCWRLEEETHSLRYWFAPEIVAFGQAAGLQHLRAEEWLSGRAPGVGTWGVCHLLQRP